MFPQQSQGKRTVSKGRVWGFMTRQLFLVMTDEEHLGTDVKRWQ